MINHVFISFSAVQIYDLSDTVFISLQNCICKLTCRLTQPGSNVLHRNLTTPNSMLKEVKLSETALWNSRFRLREKPMNSISLFWDWSRFSLFHSRNLKLVVFHFLAYWETNSLKVFPNTLSFTARGTALNKMYKTCKIFRTCLRTAQTNELNPS